MSSVHDPDKLLSVGEVAALAGVSTKTVYRELEARNLRAAKIGGRGAGTWRVSREDFRAWYDASVPSPAPSALAPRRRASHRPPRSGSLRPLAAADRGGAA